MKMFNSNHFFKIEQQFTAGVASQFCILLANDPTYGFHKMSNCKLANVKHKVSLHCFEATRG